MSTQHQWPKLPPVQTGIRGRCPRCGEGKIFDGFLTMAKGCKVCGLDYSFADPADGPALFVICFGCIPAVAFGIWLEIAFTAPYWVHLITTLPLILLTCIHDAAPTERLADRKPVFLQGPGRPVGNGRRRRTGHQFDE
ncbi:Uncharacterized protein SADFL11_00041200 [Roseibium alexandrii DFL-11]|uniref:DUF983 domain-containing protein n=1 Tax=Roseibium alexandrii (strain DSM 17067 / NCIMB 14079 / DFL-11) TaxID=244592 RepID=A0A5E8UWP1_ROSAD|nr:Uncharacterized protein SADFL11_00041200 [Roseibium alexandrii DFL-11]